MTDTRTPSSKALLPCPFCGSPANREWQMFNAVRRLSVVCPNCPARIDTWVSVDADVAWNHRASLPSSLPASPSDLVFGPPQSLEQMRAELEPSSLPQGGAVACPFALPVSVDEIHGECGFGKYKAYALFDANGKSICDTLNADLCCLEEEYDEDIFRRWDEAGRKNMEWIAEQIATPQPSAPEGSSASGDALVVTDAKTRLLADALPVEMTPENARQSGMPNPNSFANGWNSCRRALLETLHDAQHLRTSGRDGANPMTTPLHDRLVAALRETLPWLGIGTPLRLFSDIRTLLAEADALTASEPAKPTPWRDGELGPDFGLLSRAEPAQGVPVACPSCGQRSDSAATITISCNDGWHRELAAQGRET
jgi:hypothetical protein